MNQLNYDLKLIKKCNLKKIKFTTIGNNETVDRYSFNNYGWRNFDGCIRNEIFGCFSIFSTGFLNKNTESFKTIYNTKIVPEINYCRIILILAKEYNFG